MEIAFLLSPLEVLRKLRAGTFGRLLSAVKGGASDIVMNFSVSADPKPAWAALKKHYDGLSAGREIAMRQSSTPSSGTRVTLSSPSRPK